MNKDEKFLYLTGYAAKAEEMEKAEEAHQFSERFERRQQEIIQKAAECEKQHTGKRRKNRKKWLILGAAAVLAAGLSVTAYATGIFGKDPGNMEDYLASGEIQPVQTEIVVNEFADGGSETLSMEYVDNFLIYAEPGSNEFKASKEWLEYQKSYFGSEEAIQAAANADANGLPEQFQKYSEEYSVRDQQTADKVDEIAEKYDLKLLSQPVYTYTYDEFLEATGLVDFTASKEDFELPYARSFPEGNFNGDFRVRLTSTKNETITAQISRYCDGVFSRRMRNMGEIQSYKEQVYTNQNDYQMLIYENASSGFILYHGQKGFVVISISLNDDEAQAYNFENVIREMADFFDFSQF